MKNLLLSLVFSTALLPLSAAAQDLPGFGSGSLPGMSLSLDPENPVKLLEEIVERGMAFVRDHVEITQRYQEGTNGEDVLGELSVKVYPDGKGQSDTALKGKGSFEFSRRLGGLHLQFDLNVSPSPDERRLEDYL